MVSDLPYAIVIAEIWIEIRGSVGRLYGESLVGLVYREPGGTMQTVYAAKPVSGSKETIRPVKGGEVYFQ